MKLTGQIVYNGWTNTYTPPPAGGGSGDGYLVHEVDLSSIEVAQYLDKRAVQDGIDAADVYLGARRVRIVASVLGSSEGGLWDNLDAFLAAFSPTLAYAADDANVGFLPLTYYRPTANISTWPTSAYPNGIPLQMYVRPLAPPRWRTTREDEGAPQGKGGAIRVVADLIARDPRQYSQSTISTGIGTAYSYIAYPGNYPSWPIVQFSLSASGHSAMAVIVDPDAVYDAGTDVVRLNLSSFSTGSFTLDYATRLLTRDNDGSTHPELFRWDDTVAFQQVASGTRVAGSNIGGLSSLTLTYRPAWA